MRALIARIARRLAGRPAKPVRGPGAPPGPADPWTRPLGGPTRAQARRHFARQSATPLRTRFLHRGNRTLYIAPRGIGVHLLALSAGPPAARREDCCVCGRSTAAPVAIRDVPAPGGRTRTLYACPQHIDARLTGPGSNDLPAGVPKSGTGAGR
ncbi:hypothetical protein ACWDR0_05215 [Streptomyces sp. NPDC003691]